MSIVLIDNDTQLLSSDNVDVLTESTESPPSELITDQYTSSQILQTLLTSDQFHDKIKRLTAKQGKVLYYDIIVQNERGGTWLGIQMFSASMLLPKIDPPGLTTITGEPVQSMRLFPLKNETQWKWVWDQWYVFMLDDTDDKGWVYSTGFRSKNWRGCYRFLGLTFVRRRIWIRLRQRIK